ncbi:MAG: hypothetical protein MRY83_17535 [Flavobacteriales bacterium]|nr:hypothetical protein [Flavobacteriales bacterium]
MLYLKSPVIHYFLNNFSEAINNIDNTFFGMIHGILMLCAIITITIGSALSKRKEVDSEKFKIMALWFSVALLIIVIAIPWPFSPFASRPYFR